MNGIVYLNGKLVHVHDASISVFDAGFQFGAGLFETILCIDGRPHALARHLERLRTSAGKLGIPLLEDDEAIAQAIASVLTKNSLDRGEARLKLLATPGDITAYMPIRRPTMFITAEPYLRPSLTAPWRLCMDGRRQAGPLTSHKSSSYLAARLALHEARQLGFDDMVLLDRNGNVAETSIAALMVLHRGWWIIPETPDALPSVTQGIVKDLLVSLGQRVTTKPVTSEKLFASAAILCNSLIGPFPVQSINRAPLRPLSMELLQQLRASWLAAGLA